jgi:putative ABC transport system permease protein
MIGHLLKLVWHRKRANALLMAEIFFSFLVVFAVLTMAASVLLRWNEPLGFDYHDVWMITLSGGGPGETLPGGDDAMRPILDSVLREVKSFPQIVDAAASACPAYGNATSEGVWDHDGRKVTLKRDTVTDGFANVMRVRLLRGRWFNAEDDARNFRPVVVDADLARAFFGDADPIGQKFDDSGKREDRVVGVVASYRKDGEIASTAENMVFLRKTLAVPDGDMPRNILLRVRPGTPPEFEQTLMNRIHGVAPETAFNLRRMDGMRETFLRLHLAPFLVLGIIALFLISMVALGLTGVLWQTVTRRTRELGLRRALGASGRSVRWQILGEVALLSTLSLIVGVAIVLQLPLLGVFAIVQPAIFGVGITAALAVIYAITLLCGAYPSWLASTVEPAEALRYE